MVDAGVFSSKIIGTEVQKKLERMGSQYADKAVIDDTAFEFMDQMYELAKAYTGSEKVAEKLVKTFIKIVVEMGILIQNNQLSSEEMQLVEELKSNALQLAMTFISFSEVDFTYDGDYLAELLESTKALLHRVIVSTRLPNKWHGRVDRTFNYFGNGDLLDNLFQPDGPYSQHLKSIAGCLNRLVEEGNLDL